MDVWPNLKCKLLMPIIILLSFSMLTYGRWYRPASGLLIVSKDIVSTKSIAPGTEYIIIFFKTILLKKKKKNSKKGTIKIRSLTIRERLVKKLKKIDTKAKRSNPKNPNSKIFIWELIFLFKNK